MDGTAAGHRDLLRAARRERGWSQGAAARELAALAARGAGTAATPGSLKTQLSRWENGHATPAPEHRALLAELYGRSATELGLLPPDPGPGPAAAAADRLRAAVGAAALDGEALGLLTAQVRATAGLDHRLGATAAHGALAAQVEHLRTLLEHCLHPERGAALAALLAEAAVLAGDQERDRAVPDRAWSQYAVAADAARRAGRPDLVATARDRQARLLGEVAPEHAGPPPPGDAPGPDDPDGRAPGPSGGREPGGRVDRQSPPVPVLVDLAHGPPVRDRLEDLLAAAAVAQRAGRAEEAATTTAEARRLALRTGSVRVLAALAARSAPP